MDYVFLMGFPQALCNLNGQSHSLVNLHRARLDSVSEALAFYERLVSSPADFIDCAYVGMIKCGG